MNKWILWIVGAVIAIGIVVGMFNLFKGNTSSGTNTEEENNLTVAADEWTLGPATASATLIEYSDLQCPSCASYAPVVKQLHEAYPDKLRIVYRHFPLTNIHQHAIASAKAAESAGKQGKFWEMVEMLFKNQKTWSAQTDPTSTFEGYAKDLGLNIDQFKTDLADNTLTAKINKSRASGNALKITGTPSFFLNGVQINNPKNIDEFKTLVETAFIQGPQPATTDEAYHAHADIKVVLNGQPVDLSQDKYQSSTENPLSPDVHLHDKNGEVVHFHKKDVTLADFFNSLSLNVIPLSNQQLSVVVNGKPTTEGINYKPQDLDRILVVTHPVGENIQSLTSTVTDKACIYSEKCPERGKPPTEECVGGLGTKC